MEHTYTVIGKQMVSPSTLLVTLHGQGRSGIASYQPGQYMSVSFKRYGRYMPSRCFSIVNSPLDQDYLQFAMRVRGAFTTSAKAVKIGDKAQVYGPFGHFIYDMEQDRSTVFLAGGIGITPFVGMIRHASRLNLQNNITLIYSCHDQDDVPFAAELMAYQQQNPHFRVLFAINHGPSDKFQGNAVANGRVTSDMIFGATNGQPLSNNYFLCGPPPFMDSAIGILQKLQVPESSIITEAFSQGYRTHRKMWHGWPAQVYGLTALSMVFTTVVIAARDITKTQVNKSLTLAGGQTATTASNTRDQEVDGTLQQLKSNSGASTATTTAPAATAAVSPSASSAAGGSASGAAKTTTTPTPVATPAPTPTPTPTPVSTPVAVSLTFSASATSVTSGKAVTLSWSTNANATQPVTCTSSSNWSASGASGSQSVSPTATTTYTLSCSNSAGSSGTKSITVTVTPACVGTETKPC